jgi:hypothetical protein
MARPARLLLLLLACVAAAACGKKGPPLPPLVRIPQPVSQIDARRLGNDVYVSLTVPSQNVDGSSPADVSRVDLFAVTAVAPPPANSFLRTASRLASLRVVAPPEGDGSAPPSSVDPDAAIPGARVTFRETLTAEQQRPSAAEAPSTPDSAAAPAKQAAAAGPRRYYMAYAFSDRGRTSAAGALVAVPAAAPPPPPDAVSVTYTEKSAEVTWAASPSASGYNVYRGESAAVPREDTARVVSAVTPVPVNGEPIASPGFSEPPQFGAERCYEIRAIGEVDSMRVESEPARTCVTFVDTFPPAAPTDLRALSRDDGGVELRWNANTEPDLAGYLILRGTAGDATLLQITETPVAQTRYTDRAVMAGVRYVYAVIAVDRAAPAPNRSPESERDGVTAR